MSMALGAFLAGVLLAESTYRHELEADIEPFRGLLLALFFMGVGMTIDMRIVWANLWLILAAALLITLLKAGIVWALFRATCVEARRRPARRLGAHRCRRIRLRAASARHRAGRSQRQRRAAFCPRSPRSRCCSARRSRP